MRAMRWIVVALALLLGGWLAFDGARALLVGDYVTPSSGAHVGRLGPWAALVEAVGIGPRSTLMKSIHVALGAAWLVSIVGYARNRSWGRKALIGCAALSLWYLPFGTLISVLLIVLLGLSPAPAAPRGTAIPGA